MFALSINIVFDFCTYFFFLKVFLLSDILFNKFGVSNDDDFLA